MINVLLSVVLYTIVGLITVVMALLVVTFLIIATKTAVEVLRETFTTRSVGGRKPPERTPRALKNKTVTGNENLPEL